MYLMKQAFMGLLAGLVNGSNHRQSTLLSNQKCIINILFNLYPIEYNQEFHFYPFAVR